MNDDVVAVLQRAKELVANGWMQGTEESRDGRRVCMARALRRADPGYDWLFSIDAHPAYAYLARAIGVDERFEGIPQATTVAEWQDMPERMQADCLDAFDVAIRLAKAGEAANTCATCGGPVVLCSCGASVCYCNLLGHAGCS